MSCNEELQRHKHAMVGRMESGNFSEDTILFKMQPGYYLASGSYVIEPEASWWARCEKLSAGAPVRTEDEPEWERRADGQRVRKDRWETGFRHIAGILIGARTEFEIPDIVERVRALAKALAAPQAAGVSDAVETIKRIAAQLAVDDCEGDAADLIDALHALTAAGSAPEGWVLVPEIGAEVRADHPQTALNPTPTFEVVAVEVDSTGARARGENTCWFGVSMLSPASPTPPAAPQESTP